jgi:hypothetical protein
MSRIFLFISSFFFIIQSCFSQQNSNSGTGILFHGIVKDANNFLPVSNSQILINREFTSVSSTDGTFSFYVSRNDTVLFKHLGYKSAFLLVSDTLAGREFVAGIFLNTDTLSIGEVVIVPRFNNLKSEIMNSPSKIPSTMENARYNVAISAYQGRTTQGKLGDPASNYAYLRQKQRKTAYERGAIPSEFFLTLSPLLLIPAGAYLLVHGIPEKPASLEQELTDQELDQIQKKYLETLKQQK